MLKSVEQLLADALKEHIFSGYQVLFYRAGEIVELSGGMTSYWPHSTRVDDKCLFDLGSLTKVIVTTSLLAQGVDRKEIELDACMGHIVREWNDSRLGELTLRQLLSHSGGLVSWYPVGHHTSWSGFPEWALERQTELLGISVRKEAIYSDVGFLLLGVVIERLWGELSMGYEKRVKLPLGLEDVCFRPSQEHVFAATEFSVTERKLRQGEVFDDNCRLLGGVTAHAGLFGTARSLSNFCHEWLKAVRGESNWLSGKTAQLFVAPARLIDGSTWALGWDTPSKEDSSAGHHFSKNAFGHLGFPGCSLWIDPDRQTYVIFLTNRIHPSRFDKRIQAFRPRLHDAIAGCEALANAQGK